MLYIQKNSIEFQFEIQIGLGRAIWLIGSTNELKNPIRLQCIDDNIWFQTIPFSNKSDFLIIEYEYIEADWENATGNPQVLENFKRSFKFEIIKPKHQIQIFDKVGQDKPFQERSKVLNLSKMKHIHISHIQKVNFGEALYVTGNILSLNDRSKGHRLEWHPGDVWSGTISIPHQEILEQKGQVILMIIKSFYHKRDDTMWEVSRKIQSDANINDKVGTLITSEEKNIKDEISDTMKLKFSKELPPKVQAAYLSLPKLGKIPLCKINGVWECEIEILRSEFPKENELNLKIDIVYEEDQEEYLEKEEEISVIYASNLQEIKLPSTKQSPRIINNQENQNQNSFTITDNISTNENENYNENSNQNKNVISNENKINIKDNQVIKNKNKNLTKNQNQNQNQNKNENVNVNLNVNDNESDENESSDENDNENEIGSDANESNESQNEDENKYENQFQNKNKNENKNKSQSNSNSKKNTKNQNKNKNQNQNDIENQYVQNSKLNESCISNILIQNNNDDNNDSVNDILNEEPQPNYNFDKNSNQNNHYYHHYYPNFNNERPQNLNQTANQNHHPIINHYHNHTNLYHYHYTTNNANTNPNLTQNTGQNDNLISNFINESCNKIGNQNLSQVCKDILSDIEVVDPSILKSQKTIKSSKQPIKDEYKLEIQKKKAQIVEQIDNCKDIIQKTLQKQEIKEKLNQVSKEHKSLAKNQKKMEDQQSFDSLLELYILSLDWAENINQEKALNEIQAKIFNLITRLFELPYPPQAMSIFMQANVHFNKSYPNNQNNDKVTIITKIFNEFIKMLEQYDGLLQKIIKTLLNPEILKFDNISQEAEFLFNLVYCILYSLKQHSKYNQPTDVFKEVNVDLFRKKINSLKDQNKQQIKQLDDQINAQDKVVKQLQNDLIKDTHEEVQALIILQFDMEALERELLEDDYDGLENAITLITGERNNQIQIIQSSQDKSLISADISTKSTDKTQGNYILEMEIKEINGTVTIKYVHSLAHQIFMNEDVSKKALSIIYNQMITLKPEISLIPYLEMQICSIIQQAKQLKILNIDNQDFVDAIIQNYAITDEESNLFNKILILHDRLQQPEINVQMLDVKGLINFIKNKKLAYTINPNQLIQNIKACQLIIQSDYTIKGKYINAVQPLQEKEQRLLKNRLLLLQLEPIINLLVLAHQWGKIISEGQSQKTLSDCQLLIIEALKFKINLQLLTNNKEDILRSFAKLNQIWIEKFIIEIQDKQNWTEIQQQFNTAFNQYNQQPEKLGIYRQIESIYEELEVQINSVQSLTGEKIAFSKEQKYQLYFLMHHSISFSVGKYLDQDFPYCTQWKNKELQDYFKRTVDFQRTLDCLEQIKLKCNQQILPQLQLLKSNKSKLNINLKTLYNRVVDLKNCLENLSILTYNPDKTQFNLNEQLQLHFDYIENQLLIIEQDIQVLNGLAQDQRIKYIEKIFKYPIFEEVLQIRDGLVTKQKNT